MAKHVLSNLTAPDGAPVTVHRIHTITPRGDEVHLTFASFRDVAANDPASFTSFVLTETEFGALSYPDGILGYAVTNWLGGGQIIADPTSFEAAKSRALVEVRSQFAAHSQAGFAHDFGGTIGVKRLDLRNADDKANWTLLLLKAQGMISAGAGAAPISIRAQDNTSFSVPATDAAAAMQAMLLWGGSLYVAKWTLDDQVKAAADQAALDAIDLTTGWPA